MNVLPFEKQCRVIAALTEGCSLRATSRLVDVDKNTAISLSVRIGEACMNLHNAFMRDLNVNIVEVDEAWSFIAKKQKHVLHGDPREFGDAYVWIAMDATNKAIVSFVTGKRSTSNAHILAQDLRARILNRPQITSDGLSAYIDAIDAAFGADCDYAMLQKEYAAVAGNQAASIRYSPGTIIGVEKRVIFGDPDPDHISTSFVERQNLTLRMGIRRMTRLTNAYSKKLRNHRAAIALHIAHYNLCRVHETLRTTPAMALGVTNHIWTIAELIHQANATPETPEPTPAPPPTLPRDPQSGLLPGRTPFKLRILPGGKIGSKRPARRSNH